MPMLVDASRSVGAISDSLFSTSYVVIDQRRPMYRTPATTYLSRTGLCVYCRLRCIASNYTDHTRDRLSSVVSDALLKLFAKIDTVLVL